MEIISEVINHEVHEVHEEQLRKNMS